MAGKALGAGNGWLFSLLAILLASAAIVALDAFSNLGQGGDTVADLGG